MKKTSIEHQPGDNPDPGKTEKIVNLLPYRLFLLNPKNEVIRQWDPSDTPAPSIGTSYTLNNNPTLHVKTIDGVPCWHMETVTKYHNLPPVIPGVFYIVSASLAHQIKRSDFLVPGLFIAPRLTQKKLNTDPASFYSLNRFLP